MYAVSNFQLSSYYIRPEYSAEGLYARIADVGNFWKVDAFSEANASLRADLSASESSGRELPAITGGADFGLLFDIPPASIGPPCPMYAGSQSSETVIISFLIFGGFADGVTAESAGVAFKVLPSLCEEIFIESPASFLVAKFDREIGRAG